MEKINETKSLCPECLQVISAELIEENNNIYIVKTCPNHGEFKDIYWSDFELYKRVMNWDILGEGILNPRTGRNSGCPFDCGLCPNHKSHTVLAIIDVTNRCNLRCPICFANAGVTGYVYEPTLDQIKDMLRNLRNNKPVPPPAIQLSGGEPTVRKDLPKIVEMTREEGFEHIEVNSNGIVLAKDINYFRKLKESGMSTVYLQFDGLSDDIYIKTRGAPLLKVKLEAIENARKIGLDSIVLVVTLAKGINDHQLGEIINFAVRNRDVIRCVNVQPVSFTGRIESNERMNMRITNADFMKLVEKQTEGKISVKDFRPVSWPVPISKAIGVLKGKKYVEFTAHPVCGVATFIVPTEDGSYIPITRLASVDKFIDQLQKAYDKACKGEIRRAKLTAFLALRYVKFSIAKKLIGNVIREGSYKALGEFMRQIIMIGSMHFMDSYNFDLQRVERCLIHYAVPDGRIIPFCSMNTIHRQDIERRFSIPVEEWRKMHVNEAEEAAAIPW